MDMAGRFRIQARSCAELGSPMYAALIDHLAEDIADDGKGVGVTASVLAGHEDDPLRSALALRLLGSVHRLVLEGRAGGLGAYYPSVGGTWEIDGGWAAFQELLADQPAEVREWLDRAPQTNEVGRAAALMGGLLRLGETYRHPVRLMEIGSSGGLLLRADRFGYTDQDEVLFGDATSRLVLREAWQGDRLRPWPELEIVERRGSDARPVDITTEEGRLKLTAYVWPDQVARLDRLRAAFGIAADLPAEVRRADAAGFAKDVELVPGTTTVLWHSVMWQYMDRDDQQSVAARIQELGARARDDMPFAHLALEPQRYVAGEALEYLVTLQLWPTGERRVLGIASPHGIPVIWHAAAAGPPAPGSPAPGPPSSGQPQ